MENKMFFENEKKTVETVTTLTEEQFHWLTRVLSANHPMDSHRGIPMSEHPNTIDNDAIGEAIKSIRGKISRFNNEHSFELNDEELTELIQKYGHLERRADAQGTVTREYETTINVPMDKDVDDLHHIDESEIEELDEEFWLNIYEGDSEDFTAEVTSVTTVMKIALPTPSEFAVSNALKKAA